MLLYDDSSSDDSSSDEDDLFVLLVESAFAPKVKLGPCINMHDIADSECEQMFRYAYLRKLLVQAFSSMPYHHDYYSIYMQYHVSQTSEE